MTYRIIKVTIIKILPFPGLPVVTVIYPGDNTENIEDYRRQMKGPARGGPRVYRLRRNQNQIVLTMKESKITTRQACRMA